MTARSNLRLTSALLAVASLTAPLAAETSAIPIPAQSQSRAIAPDNATTQLAQFAPDQDRREHRIDYEHWDEALAWFVVPMGPSIRQGAPRVDPLVGTRRIYGHESRYRLEGNRVAFSYLTPQIRQSITDYRADLEQIGSELDLSAIPRNEQLAYWINLHNVAVIEALAAEYPLAEPSARGFGTNNAALDDAILVTVDGVSLSPRDIRERIVYPNWSDPKVMYGFWRGTIDGPSIQRLAYTGGNVDALLSLSAEEFVNSLRGVERWGGALRVSPIYDEAAEFYFENTDALRAHLSQFARDDVRELVNETSDVAYKRVEGDLADLARGERDPGVNFICQQAGGTQGGDPPRVGNATCTPTRTVPNLAIQRLMEERAEKLRRARKRGIRSGMVIFGDGQYVEGETPPEVE
ncbi:DUF547 domain-containing protein [Erythrobacter sp. Alg231-14]|uniref:DUF547 domain-containing protein n=1 Tax=Erythrobacter sp. Alg231-14 TaxID=1922225 RepID=UPI000D552C8B